MNLYKVINRFKDNDGHVYEVGNPYPADGKKLRKSRAEFLTKKHSEYKIAFLEEIGEEKTAEKPVEKPVEALKQKVSKKKSDT